MRVRIGLRLLALSLIPPVPGGGQPASPAATGAGPRDTRPSDPGPQPSARDARWVAAFAVGRARESGTGPASGDVGDREPLVEAVPERDVAEALELAAGNADTLQLAIDEVRRLAVLAPPTKDRARALLSEAMRQARDPASEA